MKRISGARSWEVERPDAVSSLAPYRGGHGSQAAAYDELYQAVSGVVDEHGYAPYERQETGGFLRRKEVLVPAPIVLANGARVTARAVLWPYTGTHPPAIGYDASNYAARGSEERAFSLIAASFPYYGLQRATAFYGSGGQIATVVADRIAAPAHDDPARELYALSAGTVKMTAPSEFTPRRTILVARGVGNAILRHFPIPGSWSGMNEERIPPEGARNIRRELDTLLDPQYPDMAPRQPGLGSFPDVSMQPSRATPPYSSHPDMPLRTWVPLHEVPQV